MPNDDKKSQLAFPAFIMYGMGIEESDKETIYNFAEDFGIEFVPESKYLTLPIAVVEDVKEGEPAGLLNLFTGPVRITNFNLYVEEMEGRNALMVEYDSPSFEQYYEMIADTYQDVDHESELNFVLSYDYEGDHDIDNLTFHFNRYLPFITTSEDVSGLYDDNELNAMMLGYSEL